MNRRHAVVVFIALSLLLALLPTPDAWAITPTSISILLDGRAVVTLTLYISQSATLEASCGPADANHGTISWSSSNRRVASVNSAGVVRALTAGRVTITARSAGGRKACLALVVIDPTMPTGIAIAQAPQVVANLGEPLKLCAELYPQTALSTVGWKSSSTRVATVSRSGIITPVRIGKTTVTATTARGGKRTQVVVEVQNPLRPERVELIGGMSEMTVGETCALGFAFSPAEAVSGVTWESSNTCVLTVEGGVVRAIRPGLATVCAVATRGGKRAALQIRVLPDPLCDAQMSSLPLEGMVIGIDPGHQARQNTGLELLAPVGSAKKMKVSSGACGVKTHTEEYETVLEVGLKLRDRLVALGAEVYMTRTTSNVNISNVQRAQMMNEAGVDLTLRLHCNSIASHSARGMRLYVASKYGPVDESYRAACALMSAMGKATGARQGGVARTSAYSGLNWSTVPSVLVEMGYISNPTEDVLLNSDWYQNKMVTGMVNGICDYLGYARP